jgi:ribosome biogenesis GTPase A
MNLELPLAERDLHLLQIEEEIKNKKTLLIKKKKDLDKKHKLNNYLETVKDDYTKYYDFIVNEKQQQYNALLLLKEYMGDLMKTEQLVNEQLRTAKYDQKDILSEIDKVKVELDELIK